MNDWPFRGAPSFWPLDAGIVYVYRLVLDAAPDTLISRREILSLEEQMRADRFKFESKRAEYTLVRAGLRRVLAAHLHTSPSSLTFDVAEHGKPHLLPPFGAVRFNVSHSHGLALIALAKDLELGVDVEQHRHKVDHVRVAKRFFSHPEQAALEHLTASQRADGFFRCWARKEAVIKANGRGIALGLDKFDVSLHPAEPARLIATRWEPSEATRWALHGLAVGPGYSAALAIERRIGQRPTRIEQWSIDP